MSSLPAPSPSSSALTPTTRSRTLLFISYRDSSARAPRRSRSGRQYDDSYQPSDENEGLIDHQTLPHTSLDVELPPKWLVGSVMSYSPEHFPLVLKKKQPSRVDYVEQVEEILAATHAKGAPSVPTSRDVCVS